ncbi:MAG: zinc-ribbon domain containing protein [Gammaproteobacteria bacterium]|nr:zinc-ribbon domain containing protein [Gammaproteobacteria bacterium]
MDEILESHWSYNKESIFPETVIKADVSRQNYSVFPRSFYVDIEKQCTQCHRWFIFYAKEQQYWYESLGFYIDSDCVKCIDCRKSEQSINTLQQEYGLLIKMTTRTKKETSRLKNIALELYQSGYIKNKHKIDNIN